MNHPLLNPESKHYQMIDGVEAITRLEGMYPKDELAIWAKITAMKYRLRIGNKDGAEKEAEKIRTYEAYFKYLTTNLCDSCVLDFATCPKGGKKFGTHDGSDNVYECENYILLHKGNIDLTAERSEPKVKFITDFEFERLSKHHYYCKCNGCVELNSINNVLTDAKRRHQQEVKDETTKTSKESHKEAIEKAIKVLFGNPIGTAKVGKDSELPKRSAGTKPNASGHPKVRVERYIIGSLLDELIGEGDGGKLPSSEEPFKVTEVQSRCYRRGSPLDWRVPEDVAVMERFETAYAELSRDLQFGNIDARDFREFISNAFTEFMESMAQVSKGQTGLDV